MTFWGIEVKPGKPFTHVFDGLKGRLHVSMATLGDGTATKKSILQCNVGNKSPVYLCSLFPGKAEALQINVEFEEAEEVVFSVLGPLSIHLSGHYLARQPRPSLDDNSESYGEDIADSETRVSINSEEDKYEDSFIDDDDPEVLPSSPVSDDEDSDYVEEVFDKKETRKGSRPRRIRKMYLSESEVEGEDEDRHPISSICKNEPATKNTEQVEEKVDERTNDTRNKTEDDSFNATGSIKDADTLVVDSQSERQFDLSVESLPLSSEVNPENGGRPKRKRKERSKEEKPVQADVVGKEQSQKDDGRNDNGIHNLHVEDTKEQKVANHSGAEVLGNISKPSIEVSPENGETPKKKKKKRLEGKTDGVASSKHGSIVKDDEANGGMSIAETVGSEQNQKSAKKGSSEHDSHRFVDGQSDEKKTKKKKKKTKTQAHVEAANSLLLLSAEENPDRKSSQIKTFPSGLSIEELETGKPDGKLATSGKKISVSFVGKLKENGRVIDSCVGSAPYKFRIGKGKVINGWDVGIDGMRVGDKRRLVIPPAMGYGSSGDVTKDIPPNAWLVYDVELVKVQ